MSATASTRAGDPAVSQPATAPARQPWHRRTGLLGPGLVLAVAVLLGACLLSIAVGSRQVPVGVVLDALWSPDPASPDHIVVRDLRLPRTLAGLLAGAALGLAGAVMQGLTRNPLADPGILGVNAGASLAVVVAISVFGITSLLGYVWFAFAGAAVASAVVYAIASTGREGATPVKLSLAGAAVSALLISLLTAVLLTDQATFDVYRFWQVGSLVGRDAELVAQVAPFVVVGVVLALTLGPVLNVLALGDDVARGLGQRTGRSRVLGAVAVVLLCGSATSVAGPIGFVGLAVPHLVRAITGPDYRWVLPYSAVLAPALLLAADVVGRVVARPGELQVGIVTAFVGAPVFIALARRRRTAQL